MPEAIKKDIFLSEEQLSYEGQYDFLSADYAQNVKLRRRVMIEIQALPRLYLEVLLIRYYLKMDYKQMSKALGTNPIRAATCLMRAEAMLKGRMERLENRTLPYPLIPRMGKPVLTQIFEADEEESVTQDMIEHLYAFGLRFMVEPNFGKKTEFYDS